MVRCAKNVARLVHAGVFVGFGLLVFQLCEISIVAVGIFNGVKVTNTGKGVGVGTKVNAASRFSIRTTTAVGFSCSEFAGFLRSSDCPQDAIITVKKSNAGINIFFFKLEVLSKSDLFIAQRAIDFWVINHICRHKPYQA
jgi:hypothetical protein